MPKCRLLPFYIILLFIFQAAERGADSRTETVEEEGEGTDLRRHVPAAPNQTHAPLPARHRDDYGGRQAQGVVEQLTVHNFIMCGNKRRMSAYSTNYGLFLVKTQSSIQFFHSFMNARC